MDELSQSGHCLSSLWMGQFFHFLLPSFLNVAERQELFIAESVCEKFPLCSALVVTKEVISWLSALNELYSLRNMPHVLKRLSALDYKSRRILILPCSLWSGKIIEFHITTSAVLHACMSISIVNWCCACVERCYSECINILHISVCKKETTYIHSRNKTWDWALDNCGFQMQMQFYLCWI